MRTQQTLAAPWPNRQTKGLIRVPASQGAQSNKQKKKKKAALINLVYCFWTETHMLCLKRSNFNFSTHVSFAFYEFAVLSFWITLQMVPYVQGLGLLQVWTGSSGVFLSPRGIIKYALRLGGFPVLHGGPACWDSRDGASLGWCFRIPASPNGRGNFIRKHMKASDSAGIQAILISSPH